MGWGGGGVGEITSMKAKTRLARPLFYPLKNLVTVKTNELTKHPLTYMFVVNGKEV